MNQDRVRQDFPSHVGKLAAEGSPQIGVIILNWNNYPATSRLLRSLEAVEWRGSTYVLDNASTDGSFERLESEFRRPELVFIRNRANLGFAAGCNCGIRRALADGCEYVLLLNNDSVVVDPRFLERLVQTAEANPTLGIVSGKIVRWPETDVVWYAGGAITWKGAYYRGCGDRDDGRWDQPSEQDFVSGALMLIRREVLELVGGLPEEYFFGHEDWEFCKRVQRLGYKLSYQPRAVIAHEAGHSHDAADPVYLYNDTLSRALYEKRNRGWFAYAMWWCAYAIYLHLLFPLVYSVRPREYLAGVTPALLRKVKIAAFRDSFRLQRVTEESLERFRVQWKASS